MRRRVGGCGRQGHGEHAVPAGGRLVRDGRGGSAPCPRLRQGSLPYRAQTYRGCGRPAAPRARPRSGAPAFSVSRNGRVTRWARLSAGMAFCTCTELRFPIFPFVWHQIDTFDSVSVPLQRPQHEKLLRHTLICRP